jgi:hypothetical protein
MSPSENALSYVGQAEIKKDVTKDGIDNPVFGNFGFVNPAFQNELIEEGWHVGWAWCAIFAKVVFKNCFPQDAKVLDKLFSPSAVQTLNNFKAEGYAINLIPSVDSLVIWQHYKDGIAQTTGHAGIVVQVNPNDKTLFYSVEGNTSTPGEREGYIVAKNPHRVALDVKNGLKVLGFVIIPKKVS